MELLGQYINGNYSVKIFDDGTKIRENALDFFESAFPENIDCKITNYCDKGCGFCHEDSSVLGEHGDILNAKFLDSLHPFTEMAIGGGNPLSHPDLENFLIKLKERNIIANITVNQDHFIEDFGFVHYLSERGLVKGIGVSLTDSSDKGFIDLINCLPNVVLHTINGITTIEDYWNLRDKGLKILILGYKYLRRGKDYFSDEVTLNKRKLIMTLPILLPGFKVLSFDNLAIEQLEVKKLLSKEEWEEFYMGDDGQFTMYVDLVKQEYAKSSVSTIRHVLEDNIGTMFSTIKQEG
jgi:hypothetical protein